MRLFCVGVVYQVLKPVPVCCAPIPALAQCKRFDLPDTLRGAAKLRGNGGGILIIAILIPQRTVCPTS